MTLQTIFHRTPREGSPGYGETWTHECKPFPADFLAEYEALSHRMGYGVRNGWKQYAMDGTSQCKTEAEYHGQIDKNQTNFINGTVRESGVARAPVKTPLEREIIRLATVAVDDRLAEKSKEAGFVAPTAANRLAIIETYADARYTTLAEKAQENLRKSKVIAGNPDMVKALEDLFGDMGPKVEENAPPVAAKAGKKS